MRPLNVATAAAALVGLCGCVGGTRHDAAAPPASRSAAPTSSHDFDVAATEPTGGLFIEPSPTSPSATLAPAPSPTVVATIVFAVPPLPGDLQMVRPADPQLPVATDHDDVGPASDEAVAAMWVAAVYTGRYDDPPDTRAAALAAVATDDVARAAAATAAPFDADVFEVRWPAVTATTATGDGWWQVTFVIKRTVAGHVGPSTSGPFTALVHVDDGVVDDWRPAP